MKKTIIIISGVIVCALLIILGVFIYTKKVESTRIKEFETAAKEYYDLHMSNIKGLDQAEVSLKMINYVNEHKNEKYDVSSLKKCKEDSKAVLTISNNKVKNVKIIINCK